MLERMLSNRFGKGRKPFLVEFEYGRRTHTMVLLFQIDYIIIACDPNHMI